MESRQLREDLIDTAGRIGSIAQDENTAVVSTNHGRLKPVGDLWGGGQQGIRELRTQTIN